MRGQAASKFAAFPFTGMDSDFAEFQDNIALLIQPVREFRWLGCSCLYSFLTPQSFFLKKVKRSFHFFQTFNRKISSFLDLLILLRQFWHSFL